MLEELSFPGAPLNEAQRRKEWLKIPRAARAAIRRLHSQFGHCPKETLRDILKGAKADSMLIQACKHFKCEDCETTKSLPRQTHKVSLPKPSEFNHTIGIDVNYLPDSEGTEYQFLNVVCCGCSLQVEILMREGAGMPSSKECYDAFMQHWITP